MEQLKSILVLMMIPAVLTVGLLLIAGGGDGVYHHEGIARFDHPRDRVFEWLSEPEHRVEWIAGLKSSACDRTSVEKGASLREVVQDEDGRRERKVEILEAVEGELFTYRLSEPGRTVEMRMRIAVLNTGRKTRVDYEYTCTFDAWWARVLEPFLGSRALGDLEADLERLDQVLRDA